MDFLIVKKIKAFIVVLFVLSVGLAGFSFNRTYANEIDVHLLSENFAYDSVLVVLDENISERNKVHSREFFGGVEVYSIEDLTYTQNPQNVKEGFCQILKLNLVECSRDSVINAIQTISKIQGVKSVEPNYIVELTRSSSDILDGNGNLNHLFWNLTNQNYGIDIVNAWDFTTGSKDIRVGIIDSGLNADCSDTGDNAKKGIDIVAEDENLEEKYCTSDDFHNIRHGSRVASVIGATANNGGVCGINWDVSLVPIQIFRPKKPNETNAEYDTIFLTNLVDAIQWADGKWGTTEQIDILNCSLYGYETEVVRNAISNFNGLVVFSAGNEGGDIDNNLGDLTSVNLPNLIVVGGVGIDTSRDVPLYTIFNYSSSGENVNIYAPGINVPVPSIESTPINGVETISGTSFAAPHVTGVAALLLSLNPNLTASQLKTAILNSAKPHPATLPNGQEQTIKLLDAYSAVKYVLENNHTIDLYAYNTKTNRQVFNNSENPKTQRKTALIKMKVVETDTHHFEINSGENVRIAIYRENFQLRYDSQLVFGANSSFSFDLILTEGIYYIVTEIETTAYTIVNTTITGPEHNHTRLWMYYNSGQHRLSCVYGEMLYASHSVLYSEIVNNKARCIGCRALLDLSRDFAEIIRNVQGRQVTLNGSYILPSGIVVLKEEDMDAYLAGTLVFYNENELPITA